MRILIIKTSSMGDVVHTLPAITDLYNYNKDIIIDWVVEEGFIDIPKCHPAVTNIIPIALRRWRKNIFSKNSFLEIIQFLRDLRKHKYDYIIDAQGLLKSAIITRLANGFRKAGLDKNSSRGKYISWAYDKTFYVDKNQHAVYKIKAVFSKVFNYPYNNQVNYGLSNLSAQLGNSKDLNKYLVFLHCTTWSSKQWPNSYWSSLIKLALDHGYKIKLNSGNVKELEQAKFIAQDFSNDLVDIMPPQSIANLINIIGNSKGVVCVDTGLGHLAAALDIPGIGIYGSTNPSLTSILSDNFVNLASKFSCAPCMQRSCTRDEIKKLLYPPCYNELTPDRVWDLLRFKLL